MASKKCIICNCSLTGRKDAKTCSSRCRKRLSLVRHSFSSQINYKAGHSKTVSRLTRSLVFIILGLAGGLSIFFSLAAPKTQAAVTNNYLNFQARLLTSTGAIVADGNYNIRFKLYDNETSGSGTLLWTELHENQTSSQGVRVVNGYFSTSLGQITSFGSLNFDQEMFLTMDIGGTTTGSPTYDGEMLNGTKRIRLTGVPYAFNAGALATTSGAHRGTLSFGTVATDPAITLPDASGTVCLQGSSNCGFAGSSGSGNYIQNGTSVQTNANFAIQTAASGSIGGLIRGASGQSVDLFQVQVNAPRTVFSISSTGTLSVGNTTDDSTIVLAASGNANSTVRKNMPVTGTVADHDVVVIDSANNGKVTTTTTASDPKVFGVATSASTPQDVVIGGVYQVNLLATNQALSRGDFLGTTTTAGKVDLITSPAAGTILGRALESKSASAGGTVWVYITPGLGGSSGSGGANTALSNLASVAINTSLLPASDDSIDLGDNTHRWRDLFLGGETLHIGTSTTDEGALSYTTSSNLLTLANNASSSNGGILVKNAADSASAFQIQNSSNRSIMNVDTSANQLSVGNTTDGSTLVLAASGNANSTIRKNMPVTGTIADHDVVVIDTANDGKVTRTTTASDTKVFGVATSASTPQDIVISGVYQVNLLATNQAISRGDFVGTTTTGGKVDLITNPGAGSVLGRALESKTSSAGGTVWVYITPGLGGGVGGTPDTLAVTYANGANSTDQTLLLKNADGGGVILKDDATPITGSLFKVQNNSGGGFLDVTSSLVTVGEAFAVSPATNSDTITLGTATETGTITVGQATTASTQTINIESANGTSSTQTINIGAGTSTTSGGKVVNIATGTPGASTTNTVHIGDGGSTTGTVAVTIGSNANANHVTILQGGNSNTGGSEGLRLQVQDAGGIAIGTATQTGTITLGQATTASTQTINIESANGTSSTQTINIAGGTSTTSGGKVVNIAAGVPGASTTNTVHIGDGGTTTGTVAVTVGSNGNANHTTVLQGGNSNTGGSEGLRLQVQDAGGIAVGTATQTGTITIGKATTASTQTINISSANGTSSTQTVEIAGGSSTTSGGKVVNIANGIPGASTTNTVAIGTGGTTTGTVGVTIGSNGNANHTTVLQGGNSNTGGSEGLRLQVQDAGGIAVGTATQTGTITIGKATTASTQTINIESANGTSSTQTINIGAGTSTTSGGKVVNIATGTPGASTTNTVHIGDGGSTTGTVAVTIGSNANANHVTILQGGNSNTGGSEGLRLQVQDAGGIAIGTATQTGTITLGQATTASTQTINIESANGTSSTQTINIAGGTSTTSGGKVVNIAAGVPGASTTNTVHIGDGGTTTGTVAVTVGSNGNANHTTVLQGGNSNTGGSEGLRLQVQDAGGIAVGTATQTGTITIGKATTASTQTINIESANGTSSTQTINIGAGTSTTSGGKVVNIATGTPGASTTNTVHIGDGGSTTGTVAVTIGSNANAAHTTLIQGGNSATAIQLQSHTSGSITLGNATRNLLTVNNSTSAVSVGNTTDGSTLVLSASANANSTIRKNMTVGGTVAANDVVVIDTAANGQVKTTTTANDSKVFGVATSASTPQDIVISGVFQVNLLSTNQAITQGDFLVTTTTAGKVDKSSSTPAAGTVLGRALESKSSSAGGTIWVYITPGIGGNGGSTTLAGTYANGTSQTDSTLALDNTRKGIIIKDASTPISASSLLTVQDNAGTTKYLDLSSTNAQLMQASGSTLTLGNSGSTSAVTLQSGSGGITISGDTTVSNDKAFTAQGLATFKANTNSTTAFRIQNSGAADTLFTADTSANKIKVGNDTGTDTATTLFVVDNATSDPTTNAINGSIYYNSSLGKFRCYQGGGWGDCTGAGVSGASNVGSLDGGSPNGNGATISGSNLYMQSATVSLPGLVNNTTQSFSGVKTFTSNTIVQTTSTTAFQVQTANSNNLFNVDTSTTANVLSNGDFEQAGTPGWSARVSATLSRSTSHQVQGNASLQAATTTSSGSGAQFNYNFLASKTYYLSFYAKLSSSSMTTFEYGHSNDTGASDVNCQTAQTLNTTWKRFTCSWSTSGTVSGTRYLYFIQTDAPGAGRNILIDAVQLESSDTSSTWTAFSPGGAVQILGLANSPLNIKPLQDSSNVLQVQNSAGNSFLNVDTAGATLSLGDTGIASTIQIGNTAGAVAQTINIGNNATASSTSSITIGNLLGTSSTVINGGTGSSAIQITQGGSGTITVGGSPASGGTVNVQCTLCNFGYNGGSNASSTKLGSSASTSTTDIYGDTLTISKNLGAAATQIDIGNSSSTNAQIINIGTNNDQGQETISIGSSNANSTLELTGGSGSVGVLLWGDSAAAFKVQDLGSKVLFTANGSADLIQIGSATTDANNILFQVDLYNNSTEPTNQDGAIYYSTARRGLRCSSEGFWFNCLDGQLYANTAVSNSVANTTTETNFNKNVSMPGSFCQAGKTIRWSAYGVYSTTGTPTLIFKIIAGSTTLGTSPTITTANNVASRTWRIQAQTTCNAAPGSGVATETEGILTLFTTDNSTSQSFEFSPNTTTTALTTSSSQVLQISAKWGTASSSNTTTMRSFTIDAMGPTN